MSRVFLITLLLSFGAAGAVADDRVDFRRDIRPILSDVCFTCHGPDAHARKAKLRLDTRDGATRDLGGYAAVVPGKPADSELVRRLTSDDADERMPPPDFRRQLTKREIDGFQKWVAQGAPWDEHWSFKRPVKGAEPEGGNTVHHFVDEGLRDEALE